MTGNSKRMVRGAGGDRPEEEEEVDDREADGDH